MLIPDLHIEKENTQHKFYLPADIFEDTALCDIIPKYKKFLFVIDNKDFKTKIIYNEDNVNIDFLGYQDEENKYIKYDNENINRIYDKDKDSICYISDSRMNWYLIKIDKDYLDGIIQCFTKKIQSEDDLKEILSNSNNPSDNIKKQNYKHIQDSSEEYYDIEEV